MAKIHTVNRLINEKSPYLKQHAMNPVDWYPWSDEALERAKREDKPIILSIGYSTCHWCHVMERESFEDEDTARLMNDGFVCIKVDREERPELDSLYIKAVQAMTGHAGWPLTVFITPDGVPFYGGSYFPPEDSFSLPSFKKVLKAVSEAYRERKQKIEFVTGDIEEVLKGRRAQAPVSPGPEVSDAAFDAGRVFFDPVSGGFGRTTKFPHSMFLKFLLKYHGRTGIKEALYIARKTLSSMAEGGIYDHVGGGFHRYSVDERWDIPHFEKMLYDNALLTEAYCLAYEKTGIGLYKDAALETVDYMLRDMRDAGGGFYAAEDADVEGEEGAYYLWGYDEIASVLGADGAKKFTKSFAVTEEGNYEGKNVLRMNLGLDMSKGLSKEMKDMKAALLAARRGRTPPDKDRKIITAWNGLAIASLVQAAMTFGDKNLADGAKTCAKFILSSLRDNGRLMRYYLDGRSGVKANIEDYALFAGGLLSIYESSREDVWLDEARALAKSMVELFRDPSDGLFYDTGRDQERLFIRERDLFDNDVPSGNSAAALLFIRLAKTTGEASYREISESILKSVEGLGEEALSYGNFLVALEELLEEKR